MMGLAYGAGIAVGTPLSGPLLFGALAVGFGLLFYDQL
jgi:hypothetical protein